MDDLVGRTLPLKFGSSFQKTSSANAFSSYRKSETTSSIDKYHTVRYDFKPASLANDRPGEVVIQSDREVTISLPTVVNTQSPVTEEGEAMAPEDVIYKGNKKPAQKECLLIIDHETGEVTLEKLDSVIMVKKTRKERCNNVSAFNRPVMTSSQEQKTAESSSNEVMDSSEQPPSGDIATPSLPPTSSFKSSPEKQKSKSKSAKKLKKDRSTFSRPPFPTSEKTSPKSKSNSNIVSPKSSSHQQFNQTATPQIPQVVPKVPTTVPMNLSTPMQSNESKQKEKLDESKKEITRVRNLSSSESESGSSGSSSDSSSASENEDTCQSKSVVSEQSSEKVQQQNQEDVRMDCAPLYPSSVASTFDLRDDLQLSDSD